MDEGWLAVTDTGNVNRPSDHGEVLEERESINQVEKFEDGTAVENMRRDLITGENPWNMERESRERLWSTAISNRTTREKVQDPTTPFPIRGCDGLRDSDKQRLGETHGRGGGIRKGSFP